MDRHKPKSKQPKFFQEVGESDLYTPPQPFRPPPSRKPKPICGAKTRKGTPCQRTHLLRGGRCPNHGGMSTGPRTPEGKAIASANARATLERRRLEKAKNNADKDTPHES